MTTTPPIVRPRTFTPSKAAQCPALASLLLSGGRSTCPKTGADLTVARDAGDLRLRAKILRFIRKFNCTQTGKQILICNKWCSLTIDITQRGLVITLADTGAEEFGGDALAIDDDFFGNAPLEYKREVL